MICGLCFPFLWHVSQYRFTWRKITYSRCLNNLSVVVVFSSFPLIKERCVGKIEDQLEEGSQSEKMKRKETQIHGSNITFDFYHRCHDRHFCVTSLNSKAQIRAVFQNVMCVRKAILHEQCGLGVKERPH